MRPFRISRAAAAVGIAALLALALSACVVAITSLLPSHDQVEVLSTRDLDQHRVTRMVLDASGITYDSTNEAGQYTITVDEADSTATARKLSRSGITSGPPASSTRSCPDRGLATCRQALRAQRALIDAGAVAAHVSLTGEAAQTRLRAQVFLPDDVAGRWPAGAAARRLSLVSGVPLDRITITDDKLVDLFSGAERAST